MKFLRDLIIAVLLVGSAVLVTGCEETAAVPTKTYSTATPVPSDASFIVQRGSVVRTLEFGGRIVPLEQVSLYFNTAGYVTQVYVQQGARVKAGDLLAELESDELQQQIAQAEFTLTAAQRLLSEANRVREQEIALGELDLEVAQVALTQAKAEAEWALLLAREELAQTKTLEPTYAAGVVSARVALDQAKDELERVETANIEALDRPEETEEGGNTYADTLQQARWNLEIANAQYEQTISEQESHQHLVKIKEIALKQAVEAVQRLRNDTGAPLVLDVQRAEQALKTLKGSAKNPTLTNDVDQAQLELEQLRRLLANRQIFAPTDGEVTSLAPQPGWLVEPFRPVIVIADPTAVEVSADLTEEQLQEITEGQAVTIISKNNTEQEWSGTVRALRYPYGGGSNTESENGLHDSARISIDDNSGVFTPGDRVRIIAVLEEKHDTLWLPPAAIRTYQGRKFVMLQYGESQRRIDVELGIEAKDQVEILKGLEEGQLIAAP